MGQVGAGRIELVTLAWIAMAGELGTTVELGCVSDSSRHKEPARVSAMVEVFEPPPPGPGQAGPDVSSLSPVAVRSATVGRAWEPARVSSMAEVIEPPTLGLGRAGPGASSSSPTADH